MNSSLDEDHAGSKNSISFSDEKRKVRVLKKKSVVKPESYNSGEAQTSLTPYISLPDYAMTASQDCESYQNSLVNNMVVLLEQVLPNDWSTLERMSKSELFQWVVKKKNEMLDLVKNSSTFIRNPESKSCFNNDFKCVGEEDVNISKVRSRAKNSMFHSNYSSIFQDLPVNWSRVNDDGNIETLKKELDEVKGELLKANELVNLLTEQIKLSTGQTQQVDETDSATKTKSKRDFNPLLIVKLVNEIKYLKKKLAESHQARQSSSNTDSAICSSYPDSKASTNQINDFKALTNQMTYSKTSSNQMTDPSSIKNPLKLSDYHEGLCLSDISTFDGHNNSGRTSDELRRGYEVRNQSLSSSIKVNFTSHHEQSFRDLDSELNRLSLVPNMDSTRLDFSNENLEVSRKISGDSRLLADMLVVSENNCRLMRDRLKEIVVFLKKLLDNPDISSLLGLSGDVSKMPQCLSETASLLEDVSVWIEEGQDVLNQTGCGEEGINTSLNRLSIIGRPSLIGQSSLLAVVKKHVDEKDECSSGNSGSIVALESHKLQQKQYDSESGTLLKQYQSEISELKEQISTMSREKLELIKQCKQLEVEISIAEQYRIEIDELRGSISSLKCHNANITEMNDRLNIESSNVKQYQSEIALLKEKISSMNIHTAEVTERYEQINMEALANRKLAETLANNLICCQQQADEFKAELDSLKKQHESLLQLKVQVEKEKNELLEARKSDSTLENEQVSKLKSEVAGCYNKQPLLETSANQKSTETLSDILYQEKINEVEARLNCLKKEHESLLLVKMKLEKEKNELIESRKTENALKNEQFLKLKSLILELSSKLQQNDDEKENCCQQLQQLTNENTELKGKLKTAKGTVEELENEKSSLHEKLKMTECATEELKNEKTLIQENLKIMETNTEQLEVERNSLKEKLEMMGSCTEVLKKEEVLLHDKLRTAESIIEELQHENSYLQGQLKNTEISLEEVKTEENFLKEKLKMMESTIEQLKKEKIELEERLKAMDSTIEKLKKEKSSLQDKLKASASVGKTSKHSKAAKAIKGISQSEVIEQINKTRSVLAETTMNLNLAQQIKEKK